MIFSHLHNPSLSIVVTSCPTLTEVEYDESHPAGAGYKKDDINRYGSNTEIMKYGAFKKEVPCGIAYFDQEGRLWEIYEVGKAIKLFREGLDEIERTVSH
jgi:hypothetical protein